MIMPDGRVVGLDVHGNVPVMSCPARWLRSRLTADPWPERIGPWAFHERLMDRGSPAPSRQGRGRAFGEAGSSQGTCATGQPDIDVNPGDATTAESISESRASSAVGRPAASAQAAPHEDAPIQTCQHCDMQVPITTSRRPTCERWEPRFPDEGEDDEEDDEEDEYSDFSS